VTAIAFLAATGEPTAVQYPGDACAVRITDLVPGADYTIRLARSLRGAGYAAFLDATADAGGVIDTRTAVPLRGTYTRADADGLFWSMRRGDPRASTPDGFLCTVERDRMQIGRAQLATARTGNGVRAAPLCEGIAGTLYLPAAPGPHPAAICLGGSDGDRESVHDYAAAFAHRGFAALALAYVGAPGLPRALVDIPIEYFERAIGLVQRHPAVASDRIAVVGRSRGGELALLLGARLRAIRAVVAHVASPYRWCGAGGPSSAAWTVRGAAMPYLAPTGEVELARIDGRIVCATTPRFHSALAHPDDDACSAIEATGGPILLLSADDDQVWPSTMLAERAMQRLAQTPGRKLDEWIAYPAAGHGATRLPGEPTTDAATYHPVAEIWLAQGGTPSGNAGAQRDAWRSVLGFLRRHLC
jgi:dienelactone hydrolase